MGDRTSHAALIIAHLFPHASTIKIWDLQAALNHRSPADSLCLNTLSVSDWLIMSYFDIMCWCVLVIRVVYFSSQLIHTCTLSHMHTHTHIHTCAHTLSYTHAHTLTCTHSHTHMHTHSHAHTHIHTCTHTHMHTQQHTGRVFRLQFDDFQIVSSSHDDTILVWDFLKPESSTATSMDTVPPQPQVSSRVHSPSSPAGWDSST